MDEVYKSRGHDPKEHRKHIQTLLKNLEELEAASDPNGADQSASGKDFRAFEALDFASELVRAVAGWALDHSAGLAKSGLSFLPLGPANANRLEDYVRLKGQVDSHEHEAAGGGLHGIFEDPRVARRAALNILHAGGCLPIGLRQPVCEALEALEHGEVLEILKPAPEAKKAKVRYREAMCQLRVLAIVEYRVALGMKKYAAQQSVGDVTGTARDTFDTWEKSLRDKLGNVVVSRNIGYARNAASYVRAARTDPKYRRFAANSERQYGDDALHRLREEMNGVRRARGGE